MNIVKTNSNEDVFGPKVVRREGRSVRWSSLKNHSDKPLISIITATYNASKLLDITIKSIRELTYKNIEWIVVDGKSNDGTLNLLMKNVDTIDYWVSECDEGIYDAWNKGVSIARGEWIAFLGAGDIYTPNSLQLYVNAINSSDDKLDLMTSKIRLVNEEGMVLRVVGKAFKWSEFNKYMSIAHVGALHHRKFFEKHGLYKTKYTSSADYELLLRNGRNIKSVFIDLVTVDMLLGGVSGGYKSIYETYLIQREYGSSVFAICRFLISLTKRLIRPFVRGY